MRLILRRVEQDGWEWIGSDALAVEIARTRDAERRKRVQELLRHVQAWVRIGKAEVQRGRQLVAWGFGAFDALHVAGAESSNADVSLTTDDRFLRRTGHYQYELRVPVADPGEWIG